MSEENVEVVKSLFAAFAERDQAAAATVLDPEVEIRPAIVGGPEGVVYHGLRGNRRFWHDVDAAWKEFRIEVEEFRDSASRCWCLDEPSLVAKEAVSPSISRWRGSLQCARGESSSFGVSAISRK